MRSGRDFSFFRVRTSSLDLDGWGRTDYGYTVGKSIPDGQTYKENRGIQWERENRLTNFLQPKERNIRCFGYIQRWSEPRRNPWFIAWIPFQIQTFCIVLHSRSFENWAFSFGTAQIPRVQFHCELRSQSQQSIAWLLTPQKCNRNRNNVSPCSVKMIAHTQGSTVQRNVLDCL